MNPKIKKAIEGVLEAEGGYVNDGVDYETMFGITSVTARKNGYTGAMKDLPRDLAFDIYYRQYVVEPGFDKVLDINEAIGFELVDTGVNMGPAVAAQFLQRTLNAFENAQLVVDGRFGSKSRTALQGMIRVRGEQGIRNILVAQNACQAVGYIERVERDPRKRRYIFGWFTNRVAL